MIKLSSLEKMLVASILFNMSLLFVRFYHTNELAYGFYPWNTFLAVLPLLFSRSLVRVRKFNIAAVILLVFWLTFFPNAPYLITDLFHFCEDPAVPFWYDLLIVFSAAWNGLLSGILSLMQVERFLMHHMALKWAKLTVAICFFLCSYGIYLGRYLRFNTWDIVVSPGKIIAACTDHVFHPQTNLMVWAFTALFGVMFGITYLTLKQFSHEKN
jgi:uncharacterized membrane protein